MLEVTVLVVMDVITELSILRMKNKGFTIIELMVAMTVMILMVGLGVGMVNRFLMRDKIGAAKNEIVGVIKQARSLAMTSQKPSSFTDQLDFVAVILSDQGTIGVYPGNIYSGLGEAYFSKPISSDDVVVSPVNFGDLIFSVPDGKLLEFVDASIDLTTASITTNGVQINITSNTADVSDYRTLQIDQSGLISEDVSDIWPTITLAPSPTTAVGNIVVPTPTPTLIPTFTPTPIPTQAAPTSIPGNGIDPVVPTLEMM